VLLAQTGTCRRHNLCKLCRVAARMRQLQLALSPRVLGWVQPWLFWVSSEGAP